MANKDHAIIDNPWEYRITSFLYECSSEDFQEHFIDMTLEKDGETRRLRFIGPQQLKIEEGFPLSTSGMEILDISDRALEDINILVGDFELSFGAITFYAKDVQEL